MISFEYPYLLLLVFLPFLVRFLFPAVKGMYGDALSVPFVTDFKNIESQNTSKTNKYFTSSKINKKWWWLFLVWVLLSLSAAKPIKLGDPIRLENKGRDVLIVTDISTSMLEDDFSFQGKRLTRLGALRAVVSDFVDKRINDRLGLVLFGTRAYLQVPLTYDRNSVQEILWSMDAGMAGNSTSIGDALGLALKTLKDSKTKPESKVIILITDGENNDGSLSFPEAIMLAKEEGVKVYTIGIGGDSLASIAGTFLGQMVSSLDERSLKQLASETKGRYFRADNLASLIDVYKEIDMLEPIDMKQNFIFPRYDLFYIPLLLAILLSAVLMYNYKKGEK